MTSLSKWLKTDSGNNASKTSDTNRKASSTRSRKRKRSDPTPEPNKENINPFTCATKRRKVSKNASTNCKSKSHSPNKTQSETEPEKKQNSYMAKRYGQRKRKKVNYSLNSFLGIKEQAKPLSDDDSEYEYSESEESSNKNKKSKNKNNKKKNKQKKNKKTNKAKQNDKTKNDKAQNDTQNQCAPRNVMADFSNEIALRRAADKSLYANKKANPFFAIQKQRRQLNKLNKNKTNSNAQPNGNLTTNCLNIELCTFPSESHVVCDTNQQVPDINYNKTNTFFIDLNEILMKDLQTLVPPDTCEVIGAKFISLTHSPISNSGPEIIDLTLNETQVLGSGSGSQQQNTIQNEYFWPAKCMLDDYYHSSIHKKVIQQASIQFPKLKHSEIDQEFKYFLSRTIGTNITNQSSDVDLFHSMWPYKYRPLHTNQVLGNKECIGDLKQWLKTWLDLKCVQSQSPSPKKKNSLEKYDDDEYYDNDNLYSDSDSDSEFADENQMLSNCIIILGPTGCGKTASIYACAAELECHILEVNCVSVNSAAELYDSIAEATQSHRVGKGDLTSSDANEDRATTFVLIDEVDNIVERNVAIARALAAVLKQSRRPIVMTAQAIPACLNNLGITKFSYIPPSLECLCLRTYVIMLCEGACLTRNEIQKIVDFHNYDLRAVLIQLQFWCGFPQTFDLYCAKRESLTLPFPINQEEHRKVNNECMEYDLATLSNTSLYQRILGYADVSCGSENSKLFWKQFLLGQSQSQLPTPVTNDELYCLIRHVLNLNNEFTNDIIFNCFTYWFVANQAAITTESQTILDAESEKEKSKQIMGMYSKYNSNPMYKSWIINTAEQKDPHETTATPTLKHDIVFEKREQETPIKENILQNKDIQSLDVWSTMIQALGDNDILQTPHGNCVTDSLYDRLHPHLNGILDDPHFACQETFSFNDHLFYSRTTPTIVPTNTGSSDTQLSELDKQQCQIFDHISDTLAESLAPFLITATINLCKSDASNLIVDSDLNSRSYNFNPSLFDGTEAKQFSNELLKYNVAQRMRALGEHCNMDLPTSLHWFDYSQFLSSVCLNEYCRKLQNRKATNTSVRRSSRRKQSYVFLHYLEAWIDEDSCELLADMWKDSFCDR